MKILSFLAALSVACSVWLVLSAFSLEKQIRDTHARVDTQADSHAVVPRPAVRFLVKPFLVVERAPIHLELWVESTPETRYLIVAASDEGGDVTRTERQIDPNAPKVWRFDWREGLPAGSFVITGALFGQGGKLLTKATSPVEVRSVAGP